MIIKIVLPVLLIAVLLLGGGCVKKDCRGSCAASFGDSETASYHKISPQVAHDMMTTKEVTVVDVRTAEEYDKGHIKNAVLVPNETIGDKAPEQLSEKDATLLVYCRSGRRSKEASKKLLELGYQNVYDLGGIIDWPYEVVTD